MKRVIMKNLRNFIAIIALAVIALGVAAYILNEQRFRFPLLSETPLKYEMALSSAAAVTPGQGQNVQVAGVQVGEITGVKLENGRAIVKVGIERKYKGLIRKDASALLRPRTGLKDMFIQLTPGSKGAPKAPEGFRIGIANTLPDVDLHEILSELDGRTRDYVRLLANGAGDGLKGRGDDLAEVFRRFRPTFRDLKLVNREVAKEHGSLRRLITSLARLNERLADDPQDLTELVDTSATTFRAFASEDDNLRDTISELAPTLTQARKTLRVVRPFAEELGPATSSLIPAMRALNRANPKVERLGKAATPIVRDEIRPFIRSARPVVRDLAPAAEGLAETFPELTRNVKVLNRFFNMLAFNPNGREPADKPGREEGYLWWLAWVSHQGTNLQNIDDANGPMRPVFLTGTCTTLQNFIKAEGVDAPLLEFGLNLSPLFANLCGDPDTGPAIDLDDLLAILPPRMTKELPKSIVEKVDPKASEKIDEALSKAEARGALK